MIEVIHIDMAKSTIFYGRIMSCGWFWWWCMDADLMSAQFFNFFLFLLWYLFFLVCVHNRFERVISRDDHFLGENITFKAFLVHIVNGKQKLFFTFLPSIDACKHSWFFHSKHKVFNCTSSPKWAPLMYIFFIFSYWILSFVWFALFWDLGDLRR